MENIDAIIEAELPEIVESEAVETEQAETPVTETEAQEEKRLTEAEWLKKERNTVSRRDKQLAKVRAQNEAYLNELSRYRQQQVQTKPADTVETRPDPNDPKWKNYHEFVSAEQKFERAQELKALREELTAKETTSVSNYREQQFLQQSDNALQQATMEYAKTVPNIEAMIQEHGQTIASFPDSIKRVIREVSPQDVVKAFHAMVEADTLEDLADMTPIQAAAAIARAASMQRPAAITRAPAPMASARGTSRGVKTISGQSSPKELLDWVFSD